MRWLWLLVAGCSFQASLGNESPPGSEKPIDAAIDAPPDAYDPLCFGGGKFYFCFTTMPSGNEDLDAIAGDQIDTSMCTGARRSTLMVGGTMSCVIAADTITLSGGQSVFVTGNRPLVLVAVQSMTLAGSIDATSVLGPPEGLGPGANPAACANTLDGATGATGGGGGAGGTFGGRGGNGGTGSNGGVAGGAAVAPPAMFDVLRGGCRGGVGAPGTALTAPGGPGGGAVMFVSRGAMTINGTIDASGGGGGGGLLTKGGGGGGGSGGMILFHAMTLNAGANAKVLANGGGGGGGANTTDGGPGADPDSTMPTMPALGAQDGGSGHSKGGDGAAGATAATNGMAGANGGGGGGGGAGVIRILKGNLGAFNANNISPPPIN